jgi:STE24 endopeptidase
MLGLLQYIVAVLIVSEAADPAAKAAARADWYAIALVVAGFALLARVVGVLIARGVEGARGGDARLGTLLFATTAGRVAGLAAFALVALPFGGAHIPETLGIASWVVVPHVLRIAPFLAIVAGLAWGLHPAHEAMRLGARTPLRAILGEYQQAALPLAPLIVLTTAGDLLGLVASTTPTVGHAMEVLGQMQALPMFLLLGGVFVVMLVLPFGLRLRRGVKPLPAGPLRSRLEAYARRIDFRARDILVWPTGGDSINAAVVGVLPRFRYVIVTDGLLATLSDEEIEAVFAHEAGHARRGHILLFFGFTSVFMLVGFVPSLSGFGETFLPTFWHGVLMVLVWLGVVMGWISRRFEQEADVFGIETLPRSPTDAEGAKHPFARALERIGDEVGAIREVTGWRHFSIADRVAFVERYVADADVRRRFRRSILLLRGTLLLVVGGFVLAAAARLPAEIAGLPRMWATESSPETIMLSALHAALDAKDAPRRASLLAVAAGEAEQIGHADDATRWAREAVALAPRNSAVLLLYAAALEKSGRPLGARLAWADLATREDVDARIRELAKSKSKVPDSR